MNDLPFLKEEKDVSDEIEVEEAQAQQPEPDPEPKGEPEPAAPPAAQPEESKHVPLTALLDERDKRKAKEQELEELRRQLAQYQQPAQKPDFYADPDAALAAAQQAAMQAAVNTKLQLSQHLAVKEFGEETVKEAYDFFDANPHLSQGLRDHPSPYHEAVKIFKRHKAMQEIGDDPEAYKARLMEQLRAEMEAKIAPSAPKAPPPSMAATPGTGSGKEPPASGFDALFARD